MSEEVVRVKVLVEVDMPKSLYASIHTPQNPTDEESKGIFVGQVAATMWKGVYYVKQVYSVGLQRLDTPVAHEYASMHQQGLYKVFDAQVP